VRISILTALALCFATTAKADENTFGVYQVNPGLTTGPVSGFRQLLVEPAGLAAQLTPLAARAGEPVGALSIENTSTAFAKITVGDVLVGILGPLTTGHIQGAAAGTYKVQLELPNGYTKTVEVGTPSLPASEAAPAFTGESEAPADAVPEGE